MDASYGEHIGQMGANLLGQGLARCRLRREIKIPRHVNGIQSHCCHSDIAFLTCQRRRSAPSSECSSQPPCWSEHSPIAAEALGFPSRGGKTAVSSSGSPPAQDQNGTFVGTGVLTLRPWRPLTHTKPGGRLVRRGVFVWPATEIL